MQQLYRRKRKVLFCSAENRCIEADPVAADNAALGFVARSGDWGAESWGRAAIDAALSGLPGLSDKCRDIGIELRRQEAEHD